MMDADHPIRVLVVNSTTRADRFSEFVAPWVRTHLECRPELEVELLDLRDHRLPFFDGPAPARNPRVYPNDEVRQLGEQVDRADCYVILAAEYNHGYSAVLKNALDWTFAEWNRKPVSFIGWGNVGGARAIEQLRQVAVELEMAPLRHAVHVLPSHMMAARDGDPTAALEPLQPRLNLLADDLTWWGRALRSAR
jgi:NAD(P)H-dependent FMN reductase